MKTKIYIGTSGWHYDDWLGRFYPPEIKGYNELKFHSEYFNSVENNSSFYRIAGESTYKTWSRMTPEHYKFSIKLNKVITHNHRLALTDDVKEKVNQIVTQTQILKNKIGAIVIQLPPSFKYDLKILENFLIFFSGEINKLEYKFDIAIELRKKIWFTDELFKLLTKYNVALVTGQSSRYPEVRHITANFAYIRMHGPKELFASKYTTEQLTELSQYIKIISQDVERIYVYFNNDYYGYAIENAKELMELCGIKIKKD